LHEGVALHRIVRVGNIMIDMLLHELPRAQALHIWRRFEVEPRQFGLVTLHRPTNVDDPRRLRAIVDALGGVGSVMPLLWPLDSRTHAHLFEFHIATPRGLRLLPPLSDLETIGLLAVARLVLTDSGEMQEATTALRVPCLTLRESTEWPITIDHGSNRLVGTSPARIIAAAREVMLGEPRKQKVPGLWDGRTAERIVDAMEAADLIHTPRRAA
jgi:UDP-N-acetylglucosamine 2-epimerase (non-hydrolysing)